MSRRSFLRSLVTLWATVYLSGCVSTPVPPSSGVVPPPELSIDFDLSRGLPIVQGLTNSKATQISVIAPAELPLKFSASHLSVHLSVKVTTRRSKGSSVVVHQLLIEGLKLNSTYTLQVRREDGSLIDSRDFQALDLRSRPAKVAMASCLYDRFLNESHAMWKSLLNEKPELLFLIGDNVYAEISNNRFPSPLDERALWIRYSETFLQLDFYRTKDLVPTLVTWDDHDYGMKDGDRRNPYKLESKYVIESFFAQTASSAFPEYSKGPGVSSELLAFGHRFLLLDNRSFRTGSDVTDLDQQTHFGDEQDTWIRNHVNGETRPTWLISGDQWFGAYHRFESYEGRHPKQFKKFLASLRGLKSPVIFASGDRHLSELMKIERELLGYETFELTSSSLHSTQYPANWDTIPNHRHLNGVALNHNFHILDLQPMNRDKSFAVRGRVVGAESKTLYDFDLIANRT